MQHRSLETRAFDAVPARAIVALSALVLSGCASGGRVPTGVATEPASASDAAPSDAMLPVRYDAATGKLFLTIRRPSEEMLYLNTLAGGLGALGLDRGQVGAEAVVRFERHGARVHMVQINTVHRAVGADSALRRSVEESFPRSVLASFPIVSQTAAGIAVDATDFFLSDVFDVVGRIRAARNGSVRIDRERSSIVAANTKAFPANTEIRAALSYVTDDPGPELRAIAPDGRSFGLQQHHSFVRLPGDPLAVRQYDPRAGLFANATFDFAQGLQGDYRQRGVVRWRLEPSDKAAYLRGELVRPVKPIVYYLDPAIPEPYRSAFVEGGMWWNTILQAAGWRDAFRIEPLPTGVDALDARYPVMYWVHRERPGPSVGPSFVDPRTGEIITTVVRMDSYRSLVNHDIYMGLVPAAGPNGLQLTAEQFAMARRRQHSAHEIGHTLGLAHNYIASSLGRASVMDYPYALIRLDPRNGGGLDISDAYRASGGAHDTLAIKYAYTWYPSAAAESAGLKAIVREAEARGLRFIDDSHVAPSGSYPAATQWVEGTDALESLERTMAVRRILIDRFDERAALPGEPLAVLNRRFAHVYLHHRYALHAATKAVGGMEFGYVLAGERTVPTRVIPPAEQRRALRMVLTNLSPAALRIPDRVAAIIPPVPAGYGSALTLIPSAAGTAFDPVSAARSLAQEIVDGLLHPQRAARLVALHERDSRNPSLDEVISELIDVTWAAPVAVSADDAGLRRVAERAVVDGLLDLAGKREATSEVRAVASHHLGLLRDRAARRTGGSAEEQGHRAQARRDIEVFFEGRDDPAKRPRPELIPLPWP